MEEKVMLIQQMVKILTRMDIRVVIGGENVVNEMMRRSVLEVLRPAEGSHILSGLLHMHPGRVYEIRSVLSTCAGVIYDDADNSYLIVGPCITETVSDSDAKSQLRRYGITGDAVRRVTDYCRSLPAVPYETFYQLMVLLAGQLRGIPEPVPYEQVDYQWNMQEHGRLLDMEEGFEDLAQMRRVERRYELSAELTEAVKRGNLSMAYQCLRQLNGQEADFNRNPDPLRNAQNMCIVVNTQLRHALEESGIHPYNLDKLSGKIGLQIEGLKTVNAANKHLLEIIRQYCRLVQENYCAQLPHFSRLAVTYIKNHLSDNLSVKSTAEALVVTPNYLSTQFHQEVGMTFIDFVNKERVEHAAALLKHTNMQIQQIAAAVGYNNTSYFAKQFVRHFRMTPRTYRYQGEL